MTSQKHTDHGGNKERNHDQQPIFVQKCRLGCLTIDLQKQLRWAQRTLKERFNPTIPAYLKRSYYIDATMTRQFSSIILLVLAGSFGMFVDALLFPLQSCSRPCHRLSMAREDTSVSVNTVQEASQILYDWDEHFNKENFSGNSLPEEIEKLRNVLPDAVKLLNEAAREERGRDSTLGRCMLGICASSLEEGMATLKSWVTSLELPRGLLHGADKDGVPLEIEGGVYIKYNTGGFLTFSQIRKSGMGFDALWKPGDAMLEPYDGNYRGVYFQVELSDDVFRQYLLPLNTFTLEGTQ